MGTLIGQVVHVRNATHQCTPGLVFTDNPPTYDTLSVSTTAPGVLGAIINAQVTAVAKGVAVGQWHPIEECMYAAG